jgi:chromate transport protein ChrA
MAGSTPGPDWNKIAMWGGIGLLGIAGAVAVASLSSTAKPIVMAASQRMNRNRGQPDFLEG